MQRFKLPEKVVAILHYGRSGSELMQSLLEGHPNIISISGDINKLSEFHATFIKKYPDSGGLDVRVFVKEFTHVFHGMFDARHSSEYNVDAVAFSKIGKNHDEYCGVNPVIFIKVFADLITEYREDFNKGLYLRVLHVAFHLALGRNLLDDMVIAYQLHYVDPGLADELVKDFPDVLFLHTVRDPLQSLGSIMRAWLTPRLSKPGVAPESIKSVPPLLILQLRNIFLGGTPLLFNYRHRSRAVRFEDIKNRPKETMEQVCRWLDIPWDDGLLETTTEGKQAWASGPYLNEVITGFDKAPLQRQHREYFSWFDRLRLRTCLNTKETRWGYDPPALFSNRIFQIFMLCMIFFPFRFEKEHMRVLEKDRIKTWFSIRGILLRAWHRSRLQDLYPDIPLLEADTPVGFNLETEEVIDAYSAILEKVITEKGEEPSSFLRRLVARFPHLPDFLYYQAVFLSKCGRLDEAKKVLLVAEQKFPEFGPLLWVAAHIALTEGGASLEKTKRVAEILGEASRMTFPIRLFKVKAQVFVDLCKMLMAQGRMKEALQAAEQGVRFFPVSEVLWSFLCACLERLGPEGDQQRLADVQDIIKTLFQSKA
ncbi:MAG: sulfotransferase [Magnetococcales bacterium]|nr:sulfotransferase [Magnetococcales bacterium]MBF0322040.1 sulfotransferase [Magnetococcales bacterium]